MRGRCEARNLRTACRLSGRVAPQPRLASVETYLAGVALPAHPEALQRQQVPDESVSHLQLIIVAGRPGKTAFAEDPVQVGDERHGRLPPEQAVDAPVRKDEAVRLASADIVFVEAVGRGGSTNRPLSSGSSACRSFQSAHSSSMYSRGDCPAG